MTRVLFIAVVCFFQSPFAFTPFAFAQVKSAAALTTKTDKTAFVGELKEGFHFNDKAPNVVTLEGRSLKPKTLRPRRIEFALPAKRDAGEASLYVCDDAITFCETHQIAIAASLPAGKPAAASAEKGGGKTGAKATAPGGKRAAAAKTNAHGFIEDDFTAALAEAKTKNRLVFVEFGAKWCPGCVRYEKEVFPTAAFKKTTKGFVKAKLDTDVFANGPIARRYKIQGIPTIVVVNGDGALVDRLVDFHSVERIGAFLKALEADPTPIDELLARKNLPSTEERLRIGRRLIATGLYEDAVQMLSPVSPAPPELTTAKVHAAQEAAEKDDKNEDALIRELRAALKAESDTTRSIGWRTELVRALGKDAKESKALVAEGRALVDKWMADDAALIAATKTEETGVGEFRGYERLLAMFLLADLVDASGADKAETAAIWTKTAEVGRAYKIPPGKSGPALRYLIVLNIAEDFPAAEAQADAILKKDPGNLDVQRRRISALLGQKKFAEAAKAGEKIIDRMIGRNQFWVAQSLAKAYLGQDKKTDAKKLLQAYLARPEMGEKNMAGTKSAMEELLKTAN